MHSHEGRWNDAAASVDSIREREKSAHGLSRSPQTGYLLSYSTMTWPSMANDRILCVLLGGYSKSRLGCLRRMYSRVTALSKHSRNSTSSRSACICFTHPSPPQTIIMWMCSHLSPLLLLIVSLSCALSKMPAIFITVVRHPLDISVSLFYWKHTEKKAATYFPALQRLLTHTHTPTSHPCRYIVEHHIYQSSCDVITSASDCEPKRPDTSRRFIWSTSRRSCHK